MSHHVSSGAVECPLASLGHNASRLDQSYHHPLSTSPLDPQAYQMLRKSQESPILSLDVDKIRYTAGKRPPMDTFPPPRHASTPLDNNTTFLSRRDLLRLRNQTYTPIDSILPSYHQATGQSFEDSAAAAAATIHHEITDVERFFLGDKMASLIIDSAIRNKKAANTNNSSSSNNHQSSSTTTTNGNNCGSNRSSTLDDVDRIENADRYYLEQQDSGNDGGGGTYNYYSIPTGQVNGYSPNLRRRASSPDTSGSDRYFLDRLRGSPAFVSRNAKLTSIKSSTENGR